MADVCAYEGCDNPRDTMVGDTVGSLILPGSLKTEREGELDFPDPPSHENSQLCEKCNQAHLSEGNDAMIAFNWTKRGETLEAWRQRLGELEAKKGEPHGLAALHGYQDKVRRMIKPPKKEEDKG